MAKLPWAIEYRPSSIKDFIFQDQTHQNLIEKFIEEKNIPHLLLQGHRGTGKTSLALLLKNELGIDDMDFMALNASDENSVDVIRNKIKNFISTYSMSEFKIVFLDEADYLTPNAQAVLRNMMEEYADNARFILTCNKPHKVIPELKSRCQELTFKSLDKESVFKRCIKILKAEGFKVKSEEDVVIIESIIDATYPDFRKTINTLQQNFVNGKLQQPSELDSTDEYKIVLLDLIEKKQWNKIRSYMAENTPDDQWEDIYRMLYRYIPEISHFAGNQRKIDDAMIIIADHLYKNAFIADQEINFTACIIKLSRL